MPRPELPKLRTSYSPGACASRSFCSCAGYDSVSRFARPKPYVIESPMQATFVFAEAASAAATPRRKKKRLVCLL